VLCLLENPSASLPYIYDYVRQFDESLVDRVRFQRESAARYVGAVYCMCHFLIVYDIVYFLYCSLSDEPL
jgi:hypothetical protein